ncbi:MAG: benzoyl-CoA reductase, bzd-type, subunit O, partial [Dehalococcoidia bacterium]|nr:benzoyl-CoA reductase, bzd-type, subunit O [Dehalococcoidia bacterium]
MVAVGRLYKTAPLHSWKTAKALRMKHYHEVMEARGKGKLIVSGGTEGFVGLPAGLGDYVYLGGEPYGATIGSDPQFSQICSEAVEARGFARDLCSYMRNYWGSMFLNRFYFGGEFPKPDFCLQMNFCDSHAKWYQLVSDYYGVPYFSIDVPMTMEPGKNSKS